MVKPPAVYIAGLLRALRRAIDTDAWAWLGELPGQQLFHPPNVAGWDDDALAGHVRRCAGAGTTVDYALARPLQLGDAQIDDYDATETPDAGRRRGARVLGQPAAHARDARRARALRRRCRAGADWPTGSSSYCRGLRQNALRHLIATSPDLQTS